MRLQVMKSIKIELRLCNGVMKGLSKRRFCVVAPESIINFACVGSIHRCKHGAAVLSRGPTKP